MYSSNHTFSPSAQFLTFIKVVTEPLNNTAPLSLILSGHTSLWRCLRPEHKERADELRTNGSKCRIILWNDDTFTGTSHDFFTLVGMFKRENPSADLLAFPLGNFS
jgi:hypothetical protein